MAFGKAQAFRLRSWLDPAAGWHPRGVRVEQPPVAALDALARALGSRLLGAAPVPWGDSGTTLRIELADGRRVAARAIEAPRRSDAVRTARAMDDARRADVPVPAPTILEAGGAIWLLPHAVSTGT